MGRVRAWALALRACNVESLGHLTWDLVHKVLNEPPIKVLVTFLTRSHDP